MLVIKNAELNLRIVCLMGSAMLITGVQTPLLAIIYIYIYIYQCFNSIWFFVIPKIKFWIL